MFYRSKNKKSIDEIEKRGYYHFDNNKKILSLRGGIE